MHRYTQGIFKQFTQTYGTVTSRDGEEFFISRFDAGGAFSGDTVQVRITKDADNRKKAEAVIIKILKRTEEPIVCLCKKKYRTGEIIIFPYRINNAAPLKMAEKKNSLKQGDIISVRIISGVENPLCVLVSHIGNERQHDIEEKIILIQNNIQLTFPEDVMRAAEKLRLPEKSQKRLDLRDLFTVTIDGEDAKDLDDAISVSLLPNNHFELWVHIADVAEYIRENDPIDIEAQKRGTSIYLPDRVIPMLPERLSNDLCSLHPGTPKLTLSIRMELDETAQVIDRSIHETIIESDHRLTYTFVADVLEKNALKSSRMNVIPDLIRDLDFIHEATSGHKIGSIEQNRNILNQVQNDKLLSLIQNAARLKKLLDIRRKKEGKIDFDLPELKILMAPDGRVSDVKKRERNEAHKIIEEFMVLANEEISKYFATKKIPFLYRTHETPGDLALQKLASIAGQYGHPFNPEKPKPRDIQIFLENIKAKPYEYHIARLTLQSMARAQYSDLLLGHYGLALYYYSHFTSPIRRYPDLQIHRIIKEFLRNELNETRLEHYRKKLKNIAIGCSNSERQAEGIERTIKELKIIEFMEKNIGNTYSGTISFINEFGCNVELENGIEGFIHESNYPYNYLYDEEKQILKAKKPGKDLFIGKPISIVVTEANKKSRRLSFVFC